MTASPPEAGSEGGGALEALALRAEAGTGPDRELDCLVAMAVLGATHDDQPEPYRRWTKTNRDGSRSSGSDVVMIRDFTASLDAVTAMFGDKMPTWKWSVRSFGAGFRGNVWSDDDQIEFYASASTPARALLAATLKALAVTLADANKKGSHP